MECSLVSIPAPGPPRTKITVTFAGSNAVGLVTAVSECVGADVLLLDTCVGDLSSLLICNACAILSRIAGIVQGQRSPQEVLNDFGATATGCCSRAGACRRGSGADALLLTTALKARAETARIPIRAIGFGPRGMGRKRAKGACATFRSSSWAGLFCTMSWPRYNHGSYITALSTSQTGDLIAFGGIHTVEVLFVPTDPVRRRSARSWTGLSIRTHPAEP
jgi:hypothetical protein